MINVIIYFVTFAALQILPGSLVLAVWKATGSDSLSNTELQMIGLILSAVLTMLLFTSLRWARPTRNYLQSRPWAVLFWCVTAACGAVIPSTWLQEQLPELPNLIEQEMSSILLHPGGYFVVCLLAPLVEELVFRGAILRELLVWRPAWKWGMIAVSALLFALIHMNPAQMPHAFVIGLLLGWMYVSTGSIVPGVAFHWTNNTIAYVLFRFYPDPSLRLADYFNGDSRAVGAALLFSLFILLPSLFQLKQRIGR